MRLLVALAAVLLVPAAHAQAPAPADPTYPVARGTRLLGGSAGVTRSDDATSAFLAPQVGVFVVDGLALSLDLNVSHFRSTSPAVEFDGFIVRDEETVRSTSIGAGPGVAYYFRGPGAPVYPFVSGDVAIAYRTSSFSIGDFNDDSVELQGGVAAGVMVPVARNVGLQAQAFYQAFDFGRGSEFEGVSSFRDVYGLSVGFTTFIY